MVRESRYLVNFKALKENRERLANKEMQITSEAVNRRDQFMKNYYKIMESAEVKRRRHAQLMEICRDNALNIAIKGIFIGALEAGTLTDNGIILAESMVETYIKENGGANKILRENKNKTYLLHRIAEIVEEAAILEAEEIEDIDTDKILDEDDDKTEDKKEEDNTPDDEEVEKAMDTIKDKLKDDDDEAQKALKVIQNKVNSENSSDDEEKEESDDNEESEENKEEEKDDSSDKDDEDLDVEKDIAGDEEPEKSESSDSEEETPVSDEELSDDDIPDTEAGSDDPDFSDGGETSEGEESSDSEEEPTSDEDLGNDEETGEELGDETDVADDIADDVEDVPDEDLTVDGDTESKGKVLDELEKEEDVKKAVDLIRQRVADAEENFIKRNAEDKKQVEELIGRISDNVKTVEDIADSDDPESKIAQEAARMNKRRINNITSNKPLTVMEKMVRLLHGNIIKDQVLRESYLDENKNVDTGLIVEAGKVMYGFLETLNTLQLEKVDASYIEKILNDMK